MATKKAGGSSRNGRDSAEQFLFLKKGEGKIREEKMVIDKNLQW